MKIQLQTLYNEYLNIKWKRGLSPVHTEPFEYGLYEDDSADLFLSGHSEATFTNWMSELRPEDPYYGSKPNGMPVLADIFNQLDVYDELVLYYLLFTLNTTMSIHTHNSYSEMNDWMKNYSFFQLAQLNGLSSLNDEQKGELRDFFFFFYLYTHPVNEETLYACSFREQDLIHTKTNIKLEHYFSAFHDHYSENRDKYGEQFLIAPHEIQACEQLTLELLRIIEGKSPKLSMPSEEGLEAVVDLINNVEQMLQMYAKNRTLVFDVMRNFLADPRTGLYRNHCFTMLLQNYASYILYFNFDEIHALVNDFRDTPAWCGIIINKIFTDAIFIHKIMRKNAIDIREYPNVIEFFDEQAREFCL
ncbi:hypothetical protein [Paenibacillus sp. JNUCC31]|uniref:hypothetical protein n=1 Tax=Paenibacillus sp. JNUCC-31 TaxID=2777983 RepID=UPI001E555501|nr:hypothetical protein [Paenibacillus sp. JNUCC-31]